MVNGWNGERMKDVPRLTKDRDAGYNVKERYAASPQGKQEMNVFLFEIEQLPWT